jgi:hypothetical protein
MLTQIPCQTNPPPITSSMVELREHAPYLAVELTGGILLCVERTG